MTHRHIQTHTAEHELAQKIPGAPTVWGTTNELDRKKKYEKSTRQSSFEPFFPAWFVFFLVYHGSGQRKKKRKKVKSMQRRKKDDKRHLDSASMRSMDGANESQPTATHHTSTVTVERNSYILQYRSHIHESIKRKIMLESLQQFQLFNGKEVYAKARQRRKIHHNSVDAA